MKIKFDIVSIGEVKSINGKVSVHLEKEYVPGLTQIKGFSHLQVIWWAHLVDNKTGRGSLMVEKLFKKAPEKLGIFSTRAPARPNPIMVSTIRVEKLDLENGIIHTPFIDAEPGTPVLDIKPYFPMERVRDCEVPEWFSHWPGWAEDATSFNWEDEMIPPLKS